MTAPVLVVHGDKKTQRLLGRVITSGVGPATVVETLTAARHQLTAAAEAPPAAVVSAELAAGDGFGAFVSHARDAGVEVVLCGEAGPTDILTLVRDHAIDHVVTCDPVGFADELPLTLRALSRRAPLDTLGVERYLSHGAPLALVAPATTHGRLSALTRVRDGLAAMGLSARHERQAALIADELLANAIYDAPAAAAGQPQHEVPRDQDRPLSARERPRLRWGGDGRYLGIEVTDQFGAIDADTIRSHVAKLVDRSTAPRQGNGGAGLGLAMTFLAASQLVFHLDAGRVTQAIGLIDLRARPDGIRALVPSLHVFTERHA